MSDENLVISVHDVVRVNGIDVHDVYPIHLDMNVTQTKDAPL